MAFGKVKRAIMKRLPETDVASLRAGRGRLRKQMRTTATVMRRWSMRDRQVRAFHKALKRPIKSNLVFWESFGGNGALCNPEALFRNVIKAGDLQHLQHVWALKPGVQKDSRIVQEFEKHPRVKVVDYRSPEYFDLLERAGYLVNNATFPKEFIKRDGQTYLNMWHGTPMKTMGYDEPKGPHRSINVLRNFLSADYLLSSGEYMTKTMYLGAYHLAPVFTGTIIEDGFPRIDRQFKLGKPRERRTLLYAPTWRGDSFHSPHVEAQHLLVVIDKLKALPELSGWDIRLKVHQSVYAKVAELPEMEHVLIPNSIPTNEILADTGLLITDFSSIWIDALATDIPVVFYSHDFEEYLETRGSYLSVDELPGPVVKTIGSLAQSLSALISDNDRNVLAVPSEYKERYADCRRRFVSHDDGHATTRIADVLFRGKRESARKLLTGAELAGLSESDTFASYRKTRVVLYPGGLKPNGISTSALNLLESFDRSRLDVTVVVGEVRARDKVAIRNRIPADVRLLCLPNGLLDTALAASYRRMLQKQMPHEGTPERSADDQLWANEWRRFVGNAEFDVAVDFSGYSGSWARIIAVSDVPRKLIWMHNDLAADAKREINGLRPYEQSLGSVFALYPYFDKLVSVSPALRDINAENLKALASRGDQGAGTDKFIYVRNSIDTNAIVGGARGNLNADINSRENMESPFGFTSYGDLASSVTALLNVYGAEALSDEVRRQALRRKFGMAEPDSSSIGEREDRPVTFITMGRMSPEKNHERLINAFAKTVESGCNARLVLLGSGPLAAELKELARSSGFSDRIIFGGHQSNPHPLLDAADCFVLSSNYEGQPMVILEALTLGKPVITTAFGSVASAFPDSNTKRWGKIVEQDVDALADAMISFVQDKESRPRPDFDPAAYNEQVLEEFQKAVAG